MDNMNDPSNSLYRKTSNDVSSIHYVDLNKDKNKNNNDYRAFFDKENFEKCIGMYPKTEVRKRVLGRVRIPD